MPLIPVLADLLGRASRALGLETVDRFPPGHQYARTRWSRAYFDIASDLGPEAMERAICAAIAATPSVFAHIASPTPRMQQALLGVIHERLRRSCGNPHELASLLLEAYRSPHTIDAVPGLRAAIEETAAMDMPGRVHALLAFLSGQRAAFGVLDA